MFRPFKLKNPVGEAYSMGAEDTLNTKKALAALGHLDTPDNGLDEYPDHSMIDAVKSFQRANGLAEDGVMKPDGPTFERLNESILARRETPSSENSILPGPRKPTAGPPFVPIALKRPVTPSNNVDLDDTSQLKPALSALGLPLPGGVADPYPSRELFNNIRAFQQREGLRLDGEMKPGGETESRMNALLKSTSSSNGGPTSTTNENTETKVAQMQEVGRHPGPSAATIAAGIAAKIFQNRLKEGTPTNTNERTDVAPTPSPQPGLEPPNEKLPDRTESIPQPIELPDLSSPLPKIEKPTVFVLPAPKPGEFGDGIVERKGNEATRKELERLRDYFVSKGWKHIAGGRYGVGDPALSEPGSKIKAGDERSEHHVPGHFKGLKGGHFTDLTFEMPDGRKVHIQSVDVDRNGKPTQRELDNAEKIRRAEKNTDVVLIPKGAQLEKLKR
jgi:peptidoglycan hydrolase-like protein with peptidoglycan-binding domain